MQFLRKERNKSEILPFLFENTIIATNTWSFVYNL